MGVSTCTSAKDGAELTPYSAIRAPYFAAPVRILYWVRHFPGSLGGWLSSTWRRLAFSAADLQQLRLRRQADRARREYVLRLPPTTTTHPQYR